MMRLYSYWQSSSAWRVRLALAHKHLHHELVTVDLVANAHFEDGFRQKNPLTQVPVLELVEDGATVRLTQSVAIIEYLEERFPERPLLPVDALGRARARELTEIVNSGIQPLQNRALRLAMNASNLDGAAFRKEVIARGLRALEQIAEETAGRFMVRDGVTSADIFLVPQLDSARRFQVDLEPFPTLRRVEVACAALPEFQSAHPNTQPDRQVAPNA